MAIVNLDSAKIKAKYNEVNVGTLTASTTDGLEYTVEKQDERTLLIVENTDTSNPYDLTIKAPVNKCYAGAVADKVVEIGAGKIAVVPVETAKYMDAVTKKVTFDSENAVIKAVVVEF